VTAYAVVFAPEAEGGRVQWYKDIAEHGVPALAQRHIGADVELSHRAGLPASRLPRPILPC